MKMQKAMISIFKEAVKSVSPENLIKSNIEVNEVANRVRICDKWLDGRKNFHLIGFGKAVYRMAVAVDKILESRLKSGVLSVPPGRYDRIDRIEVHPGAENNLPDEQSLSTTEKILHLSRNIPEDDIVIILISGGGSSLLCKPVPGVSLQEKLLAIKCLVTASANIHELNAVRKTISAVKGGVLAKTLEGRTVVSLILSDVIGDSLDVIASGPTVSNTTGASAIEVIQKYRLEMKVPRNVLNAVKNPIQIELPNENLSNYIIGSNTIALEAVLQAKELPGIPKFMISNSIDGLVDKVANAYIDLCLAFLHLKLDGQVPVIIAKIRQWLRRYNWSVTEEHFKHAIEACHKQENGILLVFGGEPTVEVRGPGKGGRSQELALLFSKLCNGAKQEQPALFQDWDVMLLSAGTDGIDGPTDAAGAIGCAEVIEKGQAFGLDLDSFLLANNSYKFLREVDAGNFQIKTGYTGTNVMDLHLLLVYKKDTFCRESTLYRTGL